MIVHMLVVIIGGLFLGVWLAAAIGFVAALGVMAGQYIMGQQR